MPTIETFLGYWMGLKLIAIFAVLAVSLISGCSSIEDIGLGGDDTASTVFSDIPVPPGFTLNESESHYQLTDTTRSGHLVYSGWKATSELVIFYQEQLSSENWTMVSINVTGYSGILEYEKSGESLYIEIQCDENDHAVLTIDLVIN